MPFVGEPTLFAMAARAFVKFPETTTGIADLSIQNFRLGESIELKNETCARLIALKQSSVHGICVETKPFSGLTEHRLHLIV